MTSVAVEFQGQQGAQGGIRGDHAGSGEGEFIEQLLQRDLSQERYKQKQSAEASAEGTGLEAQLAHIRHIGRSRAQGGRAFLVGAPRQTGESLLGESLRNGCGTELVSGLLQGMLNVIDGIVLLAQGNDALANGIPLG